MRKERKNEKEGKRNKKATKVETNDGEIKGKKERISQKEKKDKDCRLLRKSTRS